MPQSPFDWTYGVPNGKPKVASQPAPQMQLPGLVVPAQKGEFEQWTDAERRTSGVSARRQEHHFPIREEREQRTADLRAANALVVERSAPAADPTRARAFLRPNIRWDRYRNRWICYGALGWLGQSRWTPSPPDLAGAAEAYLDWLTKNHG